MIIHEKDSRNYLCPFMIMATETELSGCEASRCMMWAWVDYWEYNHDDPSTSDGWEACGYGSYRRPKKNPIGKCGLVSSVQECSIPESQK